jgi:D-threo-aldose 1-dehydrogenase
LTERNASGLQSLFQRAGPFGFGASSLGNLYREVDPATARGTVDACWDAGVRYFDTAPFYGFGLSERRLGDALRERPREEYIVSTKVGRLLVPGTAADKFGFVSPMPFDPEYDYSYDGVMRSFEASLHRLGLNRIDVLFMHDIGRMTHGDDHARTFAQAVEGGGFRAMTELRDSGLVQAIGLGVNEIEICEASLAYADLDLFMIAGRHTLLNQAAIPFYDACNRRGLGIVAAGVFNSGILAKGVGGKGFPYYDYGPAPQDVIDRVAAIEGHCAQFGVPLRAAAVQFAAAPTAVWSTVIGTANPAHIASTAALFDYPIPSEFWQALQRDGLVGLEAPLPEQQSR